MLLCKSIPSKATNKYQLYSPLKQKFGPILDRGEVNTTTRYYEALYIIDANSTEEQIQSIISKYSNIVTQEGGEVIAAGVWDKRRLAFEVKGRREGIYILMYFTGDSKPYNELDRIFKISDDVMRHIIVKVEEKNIDTKRITEKAATETETTEPVEPVVETNAEAAPAEVEAEAQPEVAEEVQAEEVVPEPEAKEEADETKEEK